MGSVTESDTPRRPSLWWVAAGLMAAVGLAWAAGAYGGRIAGTPTPTALLSDNTGFANIEPAGLGRILEAEAFWWAVGSGDLPAVLAALDEEIGTSLTHYAAFATEFKAGFEPENCRSVASNAVRCTL